MKHCSDSAVTGGLCGYVCLAIVHIWGTCAVLYRSVITEGNLKKKTANQKAKEEYEKIKAERARKKEVNIKQRYFLIIDKDYINTISCQVSWTQIGP